MSGLDPECCRHHSGMVGRDACEDRMSRLEDRLHQKIVAVRQHSARPTDIDRVEERIASLEESRQEAERAIRGLAWRLVIAAVGGGSLVPLLSHLL